MTLRQLQILRAVQRRGTLSGAAEDLDITQPAVSMQMKELRAELETALLRRRGKRLELTEAGEELASYAERVLGLVSEARVAVRARAREGGGLVRLAASSTPGIYLLPRLIGDFRRRRPRPTVLMEVMNTRAVEERVRARAIDVGVVGGRFSAAELVAEPWWTDELVLIVPPRHPLAGRRQVMPAELAGETLLEREAGSATRATYEGTFLRAGIALPRSMPLGEAEAIKRAVAAGIGIALVSRFAVADELRAGKLKSLRLEGMKLTRELLLLYPPGPPRSATVAQFLDFLRAAARQSETVSRVT